MEEKDKRFTELDASGITAECLVESSCGWDGSPLPNYPEEKPLLSIYKYVFPTHTVTADHFHKIINCGVVTSGQITLVCKNGREKTVHAGEAVIEIDGEVHHGENRGDAPAEVIMFYAGDGRTPFSFPG
ncbi:MAG: cupin domain-containing protein [Desulfovibrio sp.]|nr:cupin domain-containing protein [Desulfovibrio sp.]